MNPAGYLQQLASEPFVYGQCDCMLALAGWVHQCSGVDVGAVYRGTYSTEAGWRAAVRAAGGMVGLVQAIAPLAGLVPVQVPCAGDVAVLQLPRVGQCGAIRGSRHWHLKLTAGLWAVPGTARVLAAWRIA